MIFGCVAVSDLLQFPRNFLLNPYFIFSKNHIILYLEHIFSKWLFVHDKSSSILQFINAKSKDLPKLLRQLSGIVTSTFKAGTGGCGGWSASLSFPGPSGLSGAFLTIFVLYSNDLPSKHSHQHHQFHLYNNSATFLMSWTNFDYILTDYRHDYIKIFCIFYQCTANFCNAWSKWSIILKRNIFLILIIFICSSSS